MAVLKERASWWSITINNPTDDDRQRLEQSNWPTWVKLAKYQDEIGEKCGTLHIQGCVNTAQVRGAALHAWLPRAKILVARDKNALMKYVGKTETAVPGTQVEVKVEFLTMDKALLEIAKRADDIEDLYMPEDATQQELQRRRENWIREEYWKAVNEIVLEKPSTIGLFTNPQLERAWVKTRQTWIAILDRQDRQTEPAEEA